MHRLVEMHLESSTADFFLIERKCLPIEYWLAQVKGLKVWYKKGGQWERASCEVRIIISRDIKISIFGRTRNMWESHISDRKPQVTRSGHTFSTCRAASTRNTSPCVFPWQVALCSHVWWVPKCSEASVLHLRSVTSAGWTQSTLQQLLACVNLKNAAVSLAGRQTRCSACPRGDLLST